MVKRPLYLGIKFKVLFFYRFFYLLTRF